MNDVENALTVVIEECAEITDEICQLPETTFRGLQLGLEPDGAIKPRALVIEANDLIGSLEVLADLEPLQGLWNRDQIDAQKKKALSLMVLTKQISHLQKTACKTLRFGLDSVGPEGNSNRKAMVIEANELIGSVEHLADFEQLDGLWDREQIDAKKRKIQKFRDQALRDSASTS